jgi:hypothetical protein
MILPLGEVDFSRTFSFVKDHFIVSLGRSRDMNIARNGMGVKEKDLEGWVG